jgi:hypothetical protein
MRMRRTMLIAAAVLLGLAALLAYLRDPPWLERVESGFHRWQTTPEGGRYRWTTGHASFFVPATAAAIVIPARTTFDDVNDPSVLVSVEIDGRPADEFVLKDDDWVERRIRMPLPGPRRVRRIDLRVDRLREGNRGAQIGEIVVVR